MASGRKSSKTKRSATATEIKSKNAAANSSAKDARRELSAILLFALAVLLGFLVFVKGENVTLFVHNFIFGVFGVCTYVLPVGVLAVAVLCAMDKLRSKASAKVIESCLLVVFVCAAIDIFSSHTAGESYGQHIINAYTNGVSVKGGGFLGGVIGDIIYRCFGDVLAGVIICLIIFILLMILTGTTLMGLFRMLAKPVKTSYEQAEESFVSAKERKSAAKTSEKEPEKRNFEFDIPVDDIPEERDIVSGSLDEKGRRVVETYNAMEDKTVSGKRGSKAVHADEGANAKDPENPAFMTGEEVEIEKEKCAREIIENAKSENDSYSFPPVSLLNENRNRQGATSKKELQQTAENLVNVLKSFGVETRIVDISRGPAVTRYELQPSAGVKISKITGLADDIALNLATAGVRIEAPIPNKAAVGIEVPNKTTAAVGVRDIIETIDFMTAKSKLTVALGKDIAGNAVITDISKMPHGLIAGATGSGKSVCINTIIISLLYKASPDDVKLMLIDPKVVELGIYNGIPHLLVPVVTDPRKASGALGWAVTEMEKRYKLFAENDVRNLEGYNHLAEFSEDMPKMPQIVIVIDELADLMMTAPHEVEDSICRIAQKARAAGMHLIVATQRPSVDVVTGLIKANVPTRIAFAVSSQVDSRTILDMGGAEKLLGKGDMLFCPVGSNKPTRVQGCFVSDEEVEKVVEFIKNGQSAEYDENISKEIEKMAVSQKDSSAKASSDSENDPMINQAIECVVEAGQASTSLLQRRLKLGYARAARIIDQMEIMGVVGPYEGAKPRKVLMSKDKFLEMQAGSPSEEQ